MRNAPKCPTATVTPALLCREHSSPLYLAALSAACHCLAVHHGLRLGKREDKNNLFIYSTLLDFAVWPDKDVVSFFALRCPWSSNFINWSKMLLTSKTTLESTNPTLQHVRNTLRWCSTVPRPTRSFPGKPEHSNSQLIPWGLINQETSLSHGDISRVWYKKSGLPSAYTCWRGAFLPQMYQQNPAPVSGHGHWLCDCLKGKQSSN